MDDPRITVLRSIFAKHSSDWAEVVIAKLDAVDPLRQPVAGDVAEAALHAWIDEPWEKDSPLDHAAMSRAIAAADRARGRSYVDAMISPGHTDLMVSPEAIDEFLEKNPLPDEMGDFLKCLSRMVEMLLNDVDRDTLARMRRGAFPEDGR